MATAEAFDLPLPQRLFRNQASSHTCTKSGKPGARRSRIGRQEAATCQASTRHTKEDETTWTPETDGKSRDELPAFFPTSAEFIRGLALLDADRDGKIWASDFDRILYLAYGLQLAEQAEGIPLAAVAFEKKQEKQETENSTQMWVELKEACTTSFDGLVNIRRVTCLLAKDQFVREILRLSVEHHASATMAGSRSPRVCMRSSSFCDYVQAFTRLDRDKNGVICSRDLKEGLARAVGVEMSQEMCKEVIRQVDRNFDGVVDLVEFGELVRLLGY